MSNPTQEEIQDIVGGMIGGPHVNVSVTYNDVTGKLTFTGAAEADTLSTVCTRGSTYAGSIDIGGDIEVGSNVLVDGYVQAEGSVRATGLGLRDYTETYRLWFVVDASMTTDNWLDWYTNDKNFYLNIDGVDESVITLQDWFDQGVKTSDSPSFDGLTIGSAAVLTDYTLTFHGNNADCVITWLDAGDALKIDQDVKANRLGVFDVSGDYALYFNYVGTLSTDQGISINTNDKGFSIDMDGTSGETISLQDWFDQGVKTTSTPQFLRTGVGVAADATSLLKVYAADTVCDNAWVAQISNLEATAGRNYGLSITGGSNASDGAFYVRNVGLEPLLYLYGSGLFVLYGIEGGDATFQLQADNGDDYPDFWRFSAYASGTLAIDNKSDAVTWVPRFSIAPTGIVSLRESLTMASAKWVGLGAAAGRLVFTDAATVTFSDCNVGIGMTPNYALDITGGATVYAAGIYAHIGSGNFGHGLRVVTDCTKVNNFGIYCSSEGVGGTTNIGIRADASGASTNYSVYGTGDAYFTADVSALTFTDRTPWPDSTQESYAAIATMRGVDGMVDKKTLHSILVREQQDCDGHVIKGRDLSMTVSALVDVVNDLTRRLVTIEKG